MTIDSTVDANESVLLSVVVPAFNEQALLAKSLGKIKNALIASNISNNQWELIVCDNNSTDRTAEIARKMGATVVFEKINQISRARNTGAREARGAWLLFIDADSFPTPELIDDVYELIQSRDYCGGGSTVKAYDGPWWFHWVVMLPFGDWWLRLRKYAAGAFLFCRVDLFHSLGGFDETLYIFEEIDFSKRLKVIAEPESLEFKVLHKHPLQTSARKIKLYGFAESMTFLKNMAFGFKNTVADRSKLSIWYDGRR